MDLKVIINPTLSPQEVPELWAQIGWSRRDQDYPVLFERSNFWAGVRNEHGRLRAFGYVCGMGLEHGYLEDIIVHPDYQGRRIGAELVKGLLKEAERFG
ncbi:GNAT family N-acetyltransferase [Shouchella patagoniensis]|uniref:GNAT family N-acetyltransferase n=1 Tax=Shouchella patagoniensis TaxID=228576 RepID=UPI001475A38F